MSGGYYQFRNDGRRGAKAHAARDAVSDSLARTGHSQDLDKVNAIARDLAASRIAADSGDLDAMREANDNIERLKSALADLSSAGGKIRFNSTLGEYLVD